jgi:hypothetical protein
MTAPVAVAVWLQPVLLTVLALRVAAGDAEAPWLALGALIAPLVALLAPTRRLAGSNPVAAAAATLTLTMVLAADFVVAADAATLLGGTPWHGVGLAAGLALLMPLLPASRWIGTLAPAVAVVALLVPLAAVALAMGTAPWSAWSHGSLRAALTFPEASEWVVDGERFPRPARLTFTEGQRVTALTAGMYRVVERDVTPPTVRQWRLDAGEALTLRPGDELSIEAGARLRFDAGRRVPGAPASGIAWADAPARGPAMLPGALGALVTLVGGALALVPATRQWGLPAAGAPLVLMAAVATAVGWGVYAAAAAPDLALGGSLLAPLLRLPPRALGARTGDAVAALALGAVGVLLVTAAMALRRRLAGTAGPRRAVWAAVVGLAATLAAWSPDPWRLLVLGLGLAAAVWTPSLLASHRAAALAGSGVGAVVFVGLSGLPLLAPGVEAWLDTLVRYPALVAMPLGWATARALGDPAGAGRSRARRAAQ